MTAPLEDPGYVPVHQPTRGRVPGVVIRWFRRFWRTLDGQRDQLPMVPSRSQPGRYEREGESNWTPLAEYWCQSEHHKGPCCYSCGEEFEAGTGVMMDGWCCCRHERPHQ